MLLIYRVEYCFANIQKEKILIEIFSGNGVPGEARIGGTVLIRFLSNECGRSGSGEHILFETFMEPGIPAWVFWIMVGAGIIIQGIGKSGFAGVNVLTIPLMALVMPVEKVVACLLPLLVLLDFNAIYHHWSNKSWKQIKAICFPALLGILAGAFLWWWIGQEGVEEYGQGNYS